MRAADTHSNARIVAIVDDDASVRQSACRLLRACGFRVEAFASAEEFLASGYVARTACAILDIRMPGMDGLELQQRLAQSAPQIAIVFLTGHASDEEEGRARQAAPLAFLRKPVAKDALLDVLRTVPDIAES